MRWMLAILFFGSVVAAPIVTVGGAAVEYQDRDRTVAVRLGDEFAWPDDLGAADPEDAFRILSDAADATGSNVLRTTTAIDDQGRNHITHFVYIGGGGTRLFDDTSLLEGRWFTPAESRTGSVTVSSERVADPDNVGVPGVLLDGYGLTFASFPRLFDAVPSAGRYVVEAPEASADRFLEIVHDRLVVEGLVRPDFGGLAVSTSDGAVFGAHRLAVLPYALSLVAMALIVVLLLREGKAIGVQRLLGLSSARIWYRAVGRLFLTSTIVGSVVVGGFIACLPGVDEPLLWALLRGVLIMSLIGFVGTVVIGAAIVRRAHVADLIKGSMQ